MLTGTHEEIEGKKVQALQHLKILSYFVQHSEPYLHSTLYYQGSNSSFQLQNKLDLTQKKMQADDLGPERAPYGYWIWTLVTAVILFC